MKILFEKCFNSDPQISDTILVTFHNYKFLKTKLDDKKNSLTIQNFGKMKNFWEFPCV